jgi:hypothetical protein
MAGKTLNLAKLQLAGKPIQWGGGPLIGGGEQRE